MLDDFLNVLQRSKPNDEFSAEFVQKLFKECGIQDDELTRHLIELNVFISHFVFIVSIHSNSTK